MSSQDPTPLDDFEPYREYLTLLARLELGAKYQAKIDVSGIVNGALAEARSQLAMGKGPGNADPKSWLRTILMHSLTDEIRRFMTKKRDASKDVSIETSLKRSSQRLQLAAEQTSPSGAASRKERVLLLADALAKLPEEQRKAIECVSLLGITQEQAAQELGTTRGAVAGLLRRGMQKLHELLRGIEGDD